MVVVRTAGGPGGRGTFRQTWQGATIARQLTEAVQRALDETRDAAITRAKQAAPVRTGRLRDSIDGDVSAAGGKRTMTLFAGAPYALYVELGTSRARAQPFLRPAIDAEGPKLTARIRAALGSR